MRRAMTETKTPEALRAKAEELARQAAEAQAELDAQSLREWEAQQAEQRRAAQNLVDTFDAAALDRDVDEAQQALNQAVSNMPLTQALAAFLGAQYIRNHAHGDLMSARGQVGLSTTGGRRSGITEISLSGLIEATAQRDAQRHVDAYREGQQT